MTDELAGMRPGWLVKPIVWLADKMSGPLFIVQFVLFLILWMAWNTIGPLYLQFDKAPFIGLNLFMSALAGIQCAVVGVKQTLAEYRREQADKAHSERNDMTLERIERMEERILQRLGCGVDDGQSA